MNTALKVGIVVAALFVWQTNAAAETTARRATDPNGDYVRLFTTPCANDAVLARIPAQLRSQFQAGEASIERKIYGMCWVLLTNGVGILYGDGDQGQLPMSAFEPEVDA